MIFPCADSLSLRLCCATTEGVLHCAFRNELLVLFPLKLQSVQCILRDIAVDISLLLEVLFTTLCLSDETFNETAQCEKKIHSLKESNLIEKSDVNDVFVISGHSG